mgnify:CR=1 FL=1
MKIAVDNQISKAIVKSLIKKGFHIVLRAQDEQDEVWVDEALMRGATHIVSPDIDIPNLLDRLDASDVVWIDVPRGYKKDKLENYLIGSLK